MDAEYYHYLCDHGKIDGDDCLLCEKDSLRSFKGFNSSNGEICPICKTSRNIETMLIPFKETEDNKIVEAMQVHKKCFDFFMEMQK